MLDEVFSPLADWSAEVGVVYMIASLVVAAVQVGLAVIMFYVLSRRTDMPGRYVLLSVLCFFVLCGTTRFVNCIDLGVAARLFLQCANASIGIIALAAIAAYIPKLAKLHAHEELEAEIDKRTKAEAGLRSSEMKSAILLGTALDAIIILNSENYILYVNPAAEKMFGYRSEDLLGQRGGILAPERARATHFDDLARYLKGGSTMTFGQRSETTCLRRDGSEFTGELSTSGWRTTGSTYFTIVIRDVSERKEAERLLHAQQEELQAQVRQRLLLETEIGQLKMLQETQSSQLSVTSQAIDKLNTVTANLLDVISKGPH
jgi:PAS domain S-box-containing protein